MAVFTLVRGHRTMRGLPRPEGGVPVRPRLSASMAVTLLAAVGLLPCAATAASTPRADTRPNIIFIFSDDHGAQAISAYGSNRNRTPSLDRLASEGMRFANCFCGNSICAPSRATILTGVHSPP